MRGQSFQEISKKILCAYNRLCEPFLEEIGMPQVSFDILMFLTNNPEHVTAQEISEIRHIKKNLVSVHVEKLVLSGFLERAPVPGDRRKISLHCTEKAKFVTDKGIRLQKCFFDMISEGIREDQWIILKDIQDKIESNADKILSDQKKNIEQKEDRYYD